VARTKDRLDEVAEEIRSGYNVDVIPIAKDLFAPEAPKQIHDEIIALGINVSFLVNDAGQGEYGFFTETNINRELDIIQLNVTALVHLTKLFLKDMVARNEGKILNLASIVGKMPAPLLAVYAATKAFVYSFTQSVINELKGTKVTMTALLPGATETDFFYKAGMAKTKEWVENPLSNPAIVARDGYAAMMSGDTRVISGFKNKFMVAMSNVTPEQLLAENMREKHMKNIDETEGKTELDTGHRLAAGSRPGAPQSSDYNDVRGTERKNTNRSESTAGENERGSIH
jgi:short-subunit dehydrogenase